jgi:hypothetical protein
LKTFTDQLEELKNWYTNETQVYVDLSKEYAINAIEY